MAGLSDFNGVEHITALQPDLEATTFFGQEGERPSKRRKQRKKPYEKCSILDTDPRHSPYFDDPRPMCRCDKPKPAYLYRTGNLYSQHYGRCFWRCENERPYQCPKFFVWADRWRAKLRKEGHTFPNDQEEAQYKRVLEEAQREHHAELQTRPAVKECFMEDEDEGVQRGQ